MIAPRIFFTIIYRAKLQKQIHPFSTIESLVIYKF